MSETLDRQAVYDAFAARRTLPRNASGGPFLAVKTTGVFCRAGCPARTPKRENCEVFTDAASAMSAGFRACQRCHPLGPDNRVLRAVIRLVEASEGRIGEAELRAAGIDPDTARRRFQDRLGISALDYARLRALGRGVAHLQAGGSVTEAQLEAGFESASGFRDAFAREFGSAPAKADPDPLYVDWTDTPEGRMILVGDADHLYLIEFTTSPALRLRRQFARLRKRHGRVLLPGRSAMTERAAAEVARYFAGELQDFTVPIQPTGTEFQQTVWAALRTIPYGRTWAYADLARAIGNDKAVRAVASANGSNGLALIIPCHRVVATGGGLGGYAGGVARKAALLRLEGAPGFSERLL